MKKGTIKRLSDKGFGFIDTGGPKDLFFHATNVEGANYETLKEGQKVTFEEGKGPKGPLAKTVRPEALYESTPPLTVLLDPGIASPEELSELLTELSTLYRMLGGSGLTFTITEVKEPVVA
ncbi:cold-shock protein [Rhodopirellula sp. UBA1907]|uniref:cold-shock protein n=1 Tax=Rhodopirellula TaxID=265488 RepID=UPI002580B8B2|nr:cold shock domain-containing protein [Rhodopirellula sp. UBA1907]|tara:strand:+ start:146 stop:508 length:363 start_codon:yes stop_codon:yes gene_type:complete